MRIGKLQALTIADIDFQQNTVRIDKTYHIIHGEDIIHETKAESSRRTVNITTL